MFYFGSLACTKADKEREATLVGSIPTVEDIYREHHAFVWRVIRRFGVPEGAVEDAVQEVFVVLHRRRGELRFDAACRGLLFGIARKVAPRFRARTPAAAPTMTEIDHRMAAVTSDPERRIESVEKAEVIRAALDAMDEGKRLTFALVVVEGMTVPEAAACQDINLNTAYARLRAAKLRVREAIEHHRTREEEDYEVGTRR